jgi:hypothetical protein
MDIEPPTLDIELKRKERWPWWVVLGCVGAIGLSAIVSPSFAVVFAASALVGLPALLFVIVPNALSARVLGSRGTLSVVAFALLFGYIALAKQVLVPFLVGVFERVLV